MYLSLAVSRAIPCILIMINDHNNNNCNNTVMVNIYYYLTSSTYLKLLLSCWYHETVHAHITIIHIVDYIFKLLSKYINV